MKISIKRFSPQNQDLNSFNTFETEEKNLLKSLIFIKENIDNSLTYRCGCKSGVCGSCAVRVNGVEKLACKTIIQDGDIIEPLKNREVVKDLVVNVSHETNPFSLVFSTVLSVFQDLLCCKILSLFCLFCPSD